LHLSAGVFSARRPDGTDQHLRVSFGNVPAGIRGYQGYQGSLFRGHWSIRGHCLGFGVQGLGLRFQVSDLRVPVAEGKFGSLNSTRRESTAGLSSKHTF